MNVLIREAALTGLRQFIEETYKKISCEVSNLPESEVLNDYFIEITNTKILKISKLSAELDHLVKELNQVFYKINKKEER